MISKICTGHSFYGAIRYICHEKKKAEILQAEGVRQHDHKLMIQDFQRQHGLRPEKRQACFHGILSFYPGEKPTDQKIIEIAEQYLEGLKIQNTQYVIIKHTDKAHLHVHLIANMVDNNSRSISDRWIALRGKKTAQQLTTKHHLNPGLTKNLSLTNYQNLRQQDQYKYKIYAAVFHHLRNSRTVEDLQNRLTTLGIEMKFKYKGQSQEKQGVSFKLGEYCFKGSEIDRNFSYNKLLQTINFRQTQPLFNRSPTEKSENTISSAKNPAVQDLEMAKDVSKELEKLLEILLKQETDLEMIPYELSQAAEQKKQQRRRYRHL